MTKQYLSLGNKNTANNKLHVFKSKLSLHPFTPLTNLNIIVKDSTGFVNSQKH